MRFPVVTVLNCLTGDFYYFTVVEETPITDTFQAEPPSLGHPEPLVSTGYDVSQEEEVPNSDTNQRSIASSVEQEPTSIPQANVPLSDHSNQEALSGQSRRPARKRGRPPRYSPANCGRKEVDSGAKTNKQQAVPVAQSIRQSRSKTEFDSRKKTAQALSKPKDRSTRCGSLPPEKDVPKPALPISENLQASTSKGPTIRPSKRRKLNDADSSSDSDAHEFGIFDKFPHSDI